MKLMSLGILFFFVGIGIGFLLRYHQIIAQTVSPSPSISPAAPVQQPIPPTGFSGQPTLPSFSSSPNISGVPGSRTKSSAPAEDPQISEHVSSTGGRGDIIQIGNITASQNKAYTGDDITFTVTIQNVASYKKFVKSFCFNSTDGNFGCSPGFNLSSGQIFTISNSGRFTSSGTKTIHVSWSQDGVNYYSPVDASSVSITIL